MKLLYEHGGRVFGSVRVPFSPAEFYRNLGERSLQPEYPSNRIARCLVEISRRREILRLAPVPTHKNPKG
jgi:hypothetical protein